MEPLKWEKIDISTHLTPDMTSYHVNMKNFMGMYTTDELKRFDGEDNSGYYEKFNKLYDLIKSDEEIEDKYLIPLDRVFPFIFSMREMRKLHDAISSNFGNMISNFAADYLRFYPYRGKYIVTNDCVPIVWNNFVTNFGICKG